MGWFVNEDDVPVELDCRCPEKDGQKPHDKDTVWLYPSLTVEGGIAGNMLWDEARAGQIPNVEALTGKLGAVLLQHGVKRWTFVALDENGDYQPVPPTTQNIAAFTRNWDAAQPVAEKANELYQEALLAPLVKRLSKSSRPGPTGGSTSRRRATSSKPRKRSRPSTTATTRPTLRALTSSAGDSSTSPRKKSA